MEKPAKRFRRLASVLVSGMASGAVIGMGGWSYATLRSVVPLGVFYGALVFSLGIILVCVCNLMLYTGKIGYVCNDWLFAKPGETSGVKLRVATLSLIFVSNVIGAVLVGMLAGWLAPSVTTDSLREIAVGKGSVDCWRTFVRSVLCGMLVYAGVDLYRRYKGVLGTFLVAACIAAFVLLGFDHCVANAFYWGSAFRDVDWSYPLKGVLLCAVGNSLGAILLERASYFIGK